MGLTLDFNIKQSDNARELSFTETTGTYNVSDNPGGYGAPNDVVGDATVVELKITPPNGTEITINMLSPATGFPTTNKELEHIVRSQDLGLGTDVQLPDGVWSMTYEVTTPGEPSIVTTTQSILISGKARCCVNKMLANIDLCDCDGSDLARALEAFTYYRIAVYCAQCGDGNKFTETLEIIHKYCNNCC